MAVNSISKRMEDAIITLWNGGNTSSSSSSSSSGSPTIPMYDEWDETNIIIPLYSTVNVAEIVNTNIGLPDYMLKLDLTAYSQCDDDQTGNLVDGLFKQLMDFVNNNLTKSSLSTASGFTVDAVLLEKCSFASNQNSNVKTISLKIYVQNAF